MTLGAAQTEEELLNGQSITGQIMAEVMRGVRALAKGDAGAPMLAIVAAEGPPSALVAKTSRCCERVGVRVRVVTLADAAGGGGAACLLYTSPSPRDS